MYGNQLVQGHRINLQNVPAARASIFNPFKQLELQVTFLPSPTVLRMLLPIVTVLLACIVQ